MAWWIGNLNDFTPFSNDQLRGPPCMSFWGLRLQLFSDIHVPWSTTPKPSKIEATIAWHLAWGWKSPKPRVVSVGCSEMGSFFLPRFVTRHDGVWNFVRDSYRLYTRWAPASYKWSYDPYKWPYKLLAGVITVLLTGSEGPPCRFV